MTKANVGSRVPKDIQKPQGLGRLGHTQHYKPRPNISPHTKLASAAIIRFQNHDA